MQRNVSRGYVPEIDGLRAIAILAVMIFHAMPQYFIGGFLGVEVFFVLSGFLITSLLLGEHDRFGRIDFRRFYLRRGLRLLPALVLMLVLVVAAGFAYFDFPKAMWLLKDAGLALSYCYNWVRAFELRADGMLAHSWSLAIEEQFYLLWPPLLAWLMTRSGSRRTLSWMVLGLAAFGALHRVLLILGGASMYRVYNGLDTRLDGILLGCALAVGISSGLVDLNRERLQKRLRFGMLPACVLLLAMFGSLSVFDIAPFIWGLPVVSLCTAILVCGICSLENHWSQSLLGSRALVWIGQRSYGLYLWHYPLNRVLRDLEVAPSIQVPLGLFLAFVAATLSFALVERPLMLRFKHRLVPQAAAEAVVAIRHRRIEGDISDRKVQFCNLRSEI